MSRKYSIYIIYICMYIHIYIYSFPKRSSNQKYIKQVLKYLIQWHFLPCFLYVISFQASVSVALLYFISHVQIINTVEKLKPVGKESSHHAKLLPLLSWRQYVWKERPITKETSNHPDNRPARQNPHVRLGDKTNCWDLLMQSFLSAFS
jgi:hypothetical protein